MVLIFFCEKNKIITPKDEKVLNGVVEKFYRKISKKWIKVYKKRYFIKKAYNCDESFITATGWGICPIKSFNKKFT